MNAAFEKAFNEVFCRVSADELAHDQSIISIDLSNKEQRQEHQEFIAKKAKAFVAANDHIVTISEAVVHFSTTIAAAFGINPEILITEINELDYLVMDLLQDHYINDDYAMAGALLCVVMPVSPSAVEDKIEAGRVFCKAITNYLDQGGIL